MNHDQELKGRCGACKILRTHYWLQIKSQADEPGCRKRAVVTESVAAILAIGPEMVEEWERREGRRRGVGVSEGH